MTYKHKSSITPVNDARDPRILNTITASARLMLDIETRIQQKFNDMKTARENMKLGIKYSSRSLGGHTTQYRKLCLEAGIEPSILGNPSRASISCKPALETPLIIIGKPCRYKACKGRNHKAHNEKCPVASSRGKTGGKNGLGDSKKRLGDTNGNFRDVRPCGCPMRQHKTTCKHSKNYHNNLLKNNTFDTKLIHQKNIQTKKILNYSWKHEAISIQKIPLGFLKSLDAVCSCCSWTGKANQAAKVHQTDVNTQNPVRVICNACEA